jgi:hypothetical protein
MPFSASFLAALDGLDSNAIISAENCIYFKKVSILIVNF